MTTTNKFKKYLIALISLMLALMLAFVCACDKSSNDDDDTSSNTETEESVTDYQQIANGDFEFYTNDDTSYPYISSIKWTRSNDKSVSSATTSSNSSGIIDVSDDAYQKLGSSSKPLIGDTDDVFNPRTPSYYGLVKNEYDADDSDKRVNPNVAGNKILMINNKVTSKPGQGTAQKFLSSSSITVNQNSYAKISVWVNTYNLTTVVKDRKDSKEFGAYISLTNSVGSVDYENVLIDNINTEGKWAEYSVYVKGSEINTATFSLTLGLGRGSKSNTDGYVEGFAYFDNVSYTSYTKAEFEALNLSCDKELTITDSTDKAEFKTDSKSIIYTANGDKKDYDETTAATYHTSYKLLLSYPVNELHSSATAITNGTFSYNSTVAKPGYDFQSGNVTLSGNYSTIDKTAFGSDAATVLDVNKINSAESYNPFVAYMYFKNASAATFTTDSIQIDAKKYVVVTFYTKSKITNTSTNYAKINLKEANKDAVSLFSDVTTSTEEGDYGYWTKYTVAVYNPTDDNAQFALNMTFGMVKGDYTDKPSWDLPKGYAIIADVNYVTLDENCETLYNNILTGSYVNKQTVYGKYNSFKDDETETESDEYSIVPDVTQQTVIPFKPTENITNFTYSSGSADTVHGIINSKYVNADGTYGKNNVAIDNLNILNELKLLKEDGITYNENAQAIVLYNKTKTNTYIRTTKATLAENSYTTIIVRLRVTGSAVANVYLTGTDYNDATNLYETISIKGDGENVGSLSARVTASSHKFDGKWTEVCFYVATGNQSIDYRVEICNGERGTDGSVGTVFVDNVYISSSSATSFNADKVQYKNEYSAIGNEYQFQGFDFTRKATVKYTDDDGNEATKEKVFDPTEVYAGNDLVKFVSYETIDVDNVIDETTSDDDNTSSDDTTTETDPYKASLAQDLPLLIISGIIAAVLIIAIIVVLVRSRASKKAKATKKRQVYYDRNSRDNALNKINEKKSKINLEKDDNPAEYDYEEAANIGNDNEVTETNEETTVEEVIDVNELTKEDDAIETNDGSSDDANA